MDRSRVRWLTLLASSVGSLALAWYLFHDRMSGTVQPDLRFFSPSSADATETIPKPPNEAAERASWFDPARPEDWKYFLTERAAHRIFPIAPENNNRYDPWTYFSDMPNQNSRHVWTEHPEGEFWWRTNSLGFRDDNELEPADLRVVIAGDSHTVGACNNSETFAALLEVSLGAAHPGEIVEVLNAALPGSSIYQYVGTLHKFRAFAPDVFVVAVYGGNDFGELIHLTHRFGQIPWKDWKQEDLILRDRAIAEAKFAMGQCFNSVFNFRCRPEDRAIMLDKAVELCSQMNEICAARGSTLIVAYIPAACDCEWKVAHEDIERARAVLALTAEELKFEAEFGRDFIAELTKRQVKVVDMQPVFARESEPPFWRTDLHLNLTGHRLMAETLLPVIESALAKRER